MIKKIRYVGYHIHMVYECRHFKYEPNMIENSREDQEEPSTDLGMMYVRHLNVRLPNYVQHQVEYGTIRNGFFYHIWFILLLTYQLFQFAIIVGQTQQLGPSIKNWTQAMIPILKLRF